MTRRRRIRSARSTNYAALQKTSKTNRRFGRDNTVQWSSRGSAAKEVIAAVQHVSVVTINNGGGTVYRSGSAFWTRRKRVVFISTGFFGNRGRQRRPSPTRTSRVYRTWRQRAFSNPTDHRCDVDTLYDIRHVISATYAKSIRPVSRRSSETTVRIRLKSRGHARVTAPGRVVGALEKGFLKIRVLTRPRSVKRANELRSDGHFGISLRYGVIET